MVALPVYAVVTVAGLLFLSAQEAGAQDTSKPDPAPVQLRWRNRPSVQIGDVRLDIRFKVASDWRRFDPELDEDEHDWRVRRGGINGEIGSHVEFQIERDLFPDGDWRDVFVRWRTFRQLEVTAGRFKIPFGLEQNVSITSTDFAFRSLASNVIPPARDTGVMVNGRFLSRGLTYEFGVFEGDGDNGELQEEQFSLTGDIDRLGPSFAGRVTALPLRRLGETFDTFRVGFAYGATEVPEGLNSLVGQSVYGTADFFEPVYVKGRRARMGAEMSFTPGPVGVTAEWMQAREQRQNQGLGDIDLSDVVTTGWYVSGTWLVTGEDKEDFNDPRRPFLQGGIGAIEIGARYEQLRFESAEKVGPAFSNPRAEHILPSSDTVWTFGVNWHFNRWVRATINALREEFDDAFRTPIDGTTEFWSGVARLQLVF